MASGLGRRSGPPLLRGCHGLHGFVFPPPWCPRWAFPLAFSPRRPRRSRAPSCVGSKRARRRPKRGPGVEARGFFSPLGCLLAGRKRAAGTALTVPVGGGSTSGWWRRGRALLGREHHRSAHSGGRTYGLAVSKSRSEATGRAGLESRGCLQGQPCCARTRSEYKEPALSWTGPRLSGASPPAKAWTEGGGSVAVRGCPATMSSHSMTVPVLPEAEQEAAAAGVAQDDVAVGGVIGVHATSAQGGRERARATGASWFAHAQAGFVFAFFVRP